MFKLSSFLEIIKSSQMSSKNLKILNTNKIHHKIMEKVKRQKIIYTEQKIRMNS